MIYLFLDKTRADIISRWELKKLARIGILFNDEIKFSFWRPYFNIIEEDNSLVVSYPDKQAVILHYEPSDPRVHYMDYTRKKVVWKIFIKMLDGALIKEINRELNDKSGNIISTPTSSLLN